MNSLNHTFLLFLMLLAGSTTALCQIKPIPQDKGQKIRVPVVFHIVQKSGRGQDVQKTITKAKITKEMEDLNKNYSAKNDMSALSERFKGLIGNPNIEFYLYDPNNNGYIKRYDLTSTSTSRPVFFKSQEILHIVVGNMGSSSNVLNKKTNPTNVNINYRDFGNGSGTVTHETGHYFGLWHVWGPSNCRKGKLRTRTDHIPDTPKQRNCTDVSRRKPCPPRNIKKRPNYNNFMDYSACRCFFTKDQAQTMRNKVIKFKSFLK